MSQERSGEAAFRVHAAKLMQQGVNVTKLAEELGVSRWALYRWKKIYQEKGPAGLVREPRRPLLGRAKAAYAQIEEGARREMEFAELERKIGQQQVQIDFLKRACKRVKESPPSNSATGGTASTERSEP